MQALRRRCWRLCAAAASAARLHGQASEGKQCVAVALSGGVDSAVAAMLLKRQGHDVFGVFMRNWDEAEETGACSGEQDWLDAQKVARHLAIPLHTADFVADYWTRVFTGFLEECSRGLTPNPDLPCNRHIKFDALLAFAASLGADSVATGHYARLRPDPEGRPQLLRGLDPTKDQSYFLASVRADALRRVRFPLGGMTKAAVRALAAEAGLPVASRRSSAGICFIGRRNFGDFLAQYAAPLPGVFVSVDTSQELGPCDNLSAVTYGQRPGLGGSPERMFVAGKDIPGRRVFLAQGPEHPALFCRAALLRQPQWLAGQPPAALLQTGSLACSYMARYHQQPRACSLSLDTGGLAPSAFTRLLPGDWPAEGPAAAVRFEAPAKAITPQQACVFYDGDVCLGSAPVLAPCRTLHETDAAEEQRAAM